MKNRNRGKLKATETEVEYENEIVEATQNISLNDNVALTEDEKNRILLYFKNCVVALEKPSLVENLKETVHFREEVLGSVDVNIPESFPFYFVAPDLVSENPFFFTCLCEYDKNINQIITLFKRIQPKRVSLNQALRSFLVFFSVCFKSKSLT